MATTKRFVAKNGLDNNGQSITNVGVSGSSITMSSAHNLTISTSGNSTLTVPSGTATLLSSGGALGTPTSGTLTNCTGLPISTGISGLGTGVATFLATPSSANLAAALTDETGSGSVVFSASPTFTGTVNAANLTLSGNLIVNGTTTTVNSNTVEIGDNIIVLNSDETGTPSQNGGIEIERGTSTNATLLWNETSDSWVAGLAGSEVELVTTSGSQTLTNKTINGSQLVDASVSNAKLANSTISGKALGTNLDTLTLGVSGTGLSGSATYNGTGAATFTVTSNATSANTASAVVARDASGNFSAGTITATLSGNATNVTGTVAVANGGTGATTQSGARTGLGATTVGSNIFTLTDPSAIRFLRINADNTVSALDASSFLSAIGAYASSNPSGYTSNTGTVTSVAVSAGTGLSGGGTVTTSGTITLNTDLSELTTSTTNTHGDYFIVVDGADNAQYKLTKGNIALSGFNNDSGWTSNTGTLTSVTVTAGTGLSGGGTISGSSGTVTLTNAGVTSVNGSTGAVTVAATNQTMYIGTTAVTINRASGALSLTGVSIDGNAGTVTNGMYLSGDQNLSGVKVFYTPSGQTYNASSSNIGLTVFNPAAGDAMMTFHVSGDYAGYFGLGGAENDLVWTGWSIGNVRNRIWHSGNDGATSGLDADLLDGNHASAFYLATNPSGYTSNTGTVTSVTVSAGTGLSGGGTVTTSGTITLSLPQAVGTTSSVTFGNVNVGTATGATGGEVRAQGEIYAFYSDARLKNFHGTIQNAGAKVASLNGYYFTQNELAKSLGYNNDKMQIGVSAQEVQAVLPEAVAPAPVDDKYLTVKYEKLVPLLIEAIKELQAEVAELKKQR